MRNHSKMNPVQFLRKERKRSVKVSRSGLGYSILLRDAFPANKVSRRAIGHRQSIREVYVAFQEPVTSPEWPASELTNWILGYWLMNI